MTKWQARFDEEEAIFRRPFSERLWYGGAAALFDGLYVAFAAAHYAPGRMDYATLVSDAAMLLLITVGLGHNAGAKELHFDFKCRQYQWRIGLLLFVHRRTGSFDEIAGLCVWSMTRFTGVAIEWKNAKRTALTLVECSNAQEAQELAEKLAARLGVPIRKGFLLPVAERKTRT